jgi:hypothetical protein
MALDAKCPVLIRESSALPGLSGFAPRLVPHTINCKRSWLDRTIAIMSRIDRDYVMREKNNAWTSGMLWLSAIYRTAKFGSRRRAAMVCLLCSL